MKWSFFEPFSELCKLSVFTLYVVVMYAGNLDVSLVGNGLLIPIYMISSHED